MTQFFFEQMLRDLELFRSGGEEAVACTKRFKSMRWKSSKIHEQKLSHTKFFIFMGSLLCKLWIEEFTVSRVEECRFFSYNDV